MCERENDGSGDKGGSAVTRSAGVRCLPLLTHRVFDTKGGPISESLVVCGLAEMGMTAASLETTQLTLCRIGGEKWQAREKLECFEKK